MLDVLPFPKAFPERLALRATFCILQRFTRQYPMNKSILTLVVTAALAAFAQAESTVKLTGVHLCCKSCGKGVDKAVGTVSGASAVSDLDAGTVTLTATDAATAQKAVDALVAAGYFGKSEDAAIKVSSETGAKDAKVSSLTVNDVHLCCGKCVKAVNAALANVSGVTSNTAEKNAKSFEIKGDFNAKDVFDSLQKAGLTGKAAN
jgi:copper chaperone CopZ